MNDPAQTFQQLSRIFSSQADKIGTLSVNPTELPAKIRYRLHQHDDLELKIVYTPEAWRSGRMDRVDKVYLTPARTRHLGLEDDEFHRNFSMHIKTDYLLFGTEAGVVQEIPIRSGLEHYGINLSALLAFLEESCRAGLPNRYHVNLSLALFFSAIGQFFQNENPLAHKNTALELRDLLHRRFAEAQLSIAQLARELGYSPNYIQTLFRREFGTTPKKYLLRYRLEQSRKLLSEQRLMTKEAAAACGFSSGQYFALCYRRMFRRTPGEERRGV